MHVPNLHWIIVEDSEVQTKVVEKVVKESGILYTHLNVRTRKDLVLKNEDPHWKKHRGVDQRNLGLKWLRHSKNIGKGVVYFADDDNTYHLDLFKEVLRFLIFLFFFLFWCVILFFVKFKLTHLCFQLYFSLNHPVCFCLVSRCVQPKEFQCGQLL